MLAEKHRKKRIEADKERNLTEETKRKINEAIKYFIEKNGRPHKKMMKGE